MTARDFGVVFDLDGTLALGDKQSDGYRPLPGALDALATLRSAGRPFAIFTNGTNHTPADYVRKLGAAGFDLGDAAMLTPAVVAAELFATKRFRRVLVLGVAGVSQPLVDAGIEVVRPGEDGAETDVDAILVGWHPHCVWRDIEAACRLGWTGTPLFAASTAPFFATRGGRTVGISGPICAAIKSVTRQRVTVVGKPSLAALRVAARRVGVAPRDLLVVGDDPGLEIAMARAGGAYAIGVTTGLAGRDAFAALPAGRRPHLVVDAVADLVLLLADRDAKALLAGHESESLLAGAAASRT